MKVINENYVICLAKKNRAFIYATRYTRRVLFDDFCSTVCDFISCKGIYFFSVIRMVVEESWSSCMVKWYAATLHFNTWHIKTITYVTIKKMKMREWARKPTNNLQHRLFLLLKLPKIAMNVKNNHTYICMKCTPLYKILLKH